MQREEKIVKKEHIWSAFHQEIQFYYYNNEHIFDTPDRERDYARISEPVMDSPLHQFINQKMAFSVSPECDPAGKYAEHRERYGEYDVLKMRKAIIDILDIVETPMRKTAERYQAYATVAVLEKVHEWLDSPA